jgi:hypothetical protein
MHTGIEIGYPLWGFLRIGFVHNNIGLRYPFTKITHDSDKTCNAEHRSDEHHDLLYRVPFPEQFLYLPFGYVKFFRPAY